MSVISIAADAGLRLKLPREPLLKSSLAVPNIDQDMLDAAQVQLIASRRHLPQQRVDAIEALKGSQALGVLAQSTGQVDK